MVILQTMHLSGHDQITSSCWFSSFSVVRVLRGWNSQCVHLQSCILMQWAELVWIRCWLSQLRTCRHIRSMTDTWRDSIYDRHVKIFGRWPTFTHTWSMTDMYICSVIDRHKQLFGHWPTCTHSWSMTDMIIYSITGQHAHMLDQWSTCTQIRSMTDMYTLGHWPICSHVLSTTNMHTNLVNDRHVHMNSQWLAHICGQWPTHSCELYHKSIVLCHYHSTYHNVESWVPQCCCQLISSSCRRDWKKVILLWSLRCRMM